MSSRVAVVLSGAAARGAFQAGALARVIPALVRQGLQPTVFLGTSAGSINAALWGSLAHLGADACGQAVTDLWKGMDRDDVFIHPARTLPFNDAPRLLWSMWGPGGGLPSLLDTRPLSRTAAEHLDAGQLARNVQDGVIDAVGVVATRIPPPAARPEWEGPAHARTVVFVDSTLPTAPIADPDRAVDVAAGPLLPEHVVASCAIPIGFPPVRVWEPAEASGWYVDGGVRLNTPLRPALSLGADKILVISAMSTSYGQPLPPSAPQEVGPDVAAVGAQAMHSLLADRMAEDLRSLRSRNRMIAQAQGLGAGLTRADGESYRVVETLVIDPEPGSLGAVAESVMKTKGERRPWNLLSESDTYALNRALRSIGDGAGRRELLSYLFFDSDYFAEQISMGEAAADKALAAGWAT